MHKKTSMLALALWLLIPTCSRASQESSSCQPSTSTWYGTIVAYSGSFFSAGNNQETVEKKEQETNFTQRVIGVADPEKLFADTTLLQELLEKKADPNTTLDQKPLIYWAIDKGNTEAVELLLTKSANITSRLQELCILTEKRPNSKAILQLLMKKLSEEYNEIEPGSCQ